VDTIHQKKKARVRRLLGHAEAVMETAGYAVEDQGTGFVNGGQGRYEFVSSERNQRRRWWRLPRTEAPSTPTAEANTSISVRTELCFGKSCHLWYMSK
jgi:hypothetical protein